MREIKFRGYDFTKKIMIPFEKIRPLDYVYDSDLDSMFYAMENHLHVMQYTGLKDKNGIEIYDGDVIKTKNSLYKVIYDKCCFWGIDEMGKYPIYQIRHYVMEDEIFEVIGNIYENPELIEKDK